MSGRISQSILAFSLVFASASAFAAIPAGAVGSIEVYGSQLFGDLLRKPLVSTTLIGASKIPKLHPAIAIGSTIAGLYVQSLDTSKPLEIRARNGGEIPSGWTNANTPPAIYPTTNQCYGCVDWATGFNTLAEYQTWTTTHAACANQFVSTLPCAGPSANSGYKLVNGTYQLDEPASGYFPWPDQPTSDVFVPDSLGGGLWSKSIRQTTALNPTNSIQGLPTQGVTGVNPTSNQPAYTSLEPLADGGIKVRHTEQYQDASGNSTVKDMSFTTNSYGTVTNVTSNTYYNTSLESVVNNTASPNTMDTTGLAQDATLQQTNSKLDDLKNSLKKDTSSFPPISEIRSISDSLTHAYDAIKNKFAPPTFTDVSASCPVWSASIPLVNITVTIDYHCAWETTVKPIIQAVMMLVWAALGVRVILSA